MSLPARIVTLLVAFAAVVAGAVFIVIHYLGSSLPVVNYASAASGGVVNVVLQEDPQNNSSTEPDWVSYFVQDPQTKAWVHTTLFSVPKNTRVNMTILGYDGCTPASNNFWSLVQGTIGNSMTVQQFKTVGQPLGPPQIASVRNTWSDCSVGHTFAIPSLHLFVPIASPVTALFNKDGCGDSPCTEGPHSDGEVQLHEPEEHGDVPLAVLHPCGGGFLDGNGGPMQTLSAWMGNMEVSA